MTGTTGEPTIVFGKLSGFGIVLIGIAALILAVSYSIKVSQQKLPPKVSQPKLPPIATPEPHEFQLIQLGELRRDQFLLDKQSGRVWVSVCAGGMVGADCKGSVLWQELFVEGITPEYSPATERQQ